MAENGWVGYREWDNLAGPGKTKISYGVGSNQIGKAPAWRLQQWNDDSKSFNTQYYSTISDLAGWYNNSHWYSDKSKKTMNTSIKATHDGDRWNAGYALTGGTVIDSGDTGFTGGTDRRTNTGSGGSGGSSADQFLWKPISEGDGNLVVLMPKGSTDTSLSIKDSSGNVIETAQKTGTYEDGRPMFRFSKPGASYGSNVSVGGQTISKGASRNVDGKSVKGGDSGDGSDNDEFWNASSLELANAMGMENISGTRAEVADLERLSPDEAIRMSIESAAKNFDAAADLTGRVNAATTSQALDRINTIAPGSKDNFGIASDQISELLSGRVPVDQVNKILSDRAELSSMLGLQGGDIQTTLKDLGLTQLDAIDKGLSMFEKIIQSAETVDPSGRQQSPRDFQFAPTQVFESEFAQNQIDQVAQQNKFNIAASPDPVARAQFQLAMGDQSLKGIPNALNYNALASGATHDNETARKMIANLGET